MSVKGGDKLHAYLQNIENEVSKAHTVRVGFLEGSYHPDSNLPVAAIMAVQEFGATIQMDARQQTIYRSVKADGEFNANARFVKASKSNYATTHDVEAYTITIPARPFFRHMIAEKSPTWGASMAGVLKANNYDTTRALQLMGEGMKDQLQASMRDWSTPPNAASTIANKGFNDPLVHTGFALNSVGVEVS